MKLLCAFDKNRKNYKRVKNSDALSNIFVFAPRVY